MVKVEKVEMFGWKNCFKVSAGGVELVVTSDVGPRIISLTKNGGKNHMVTFADTLGKTGGDKFIAYGGHRVWHAPEEEVRTYFPDNSKCEYVIKDNGIEICSYEKENNIVKGFDITMTEDGVITVDHIMRNMGHFDIELSIWSLTQFINGGLLAAPHSKLNTGLVANGSIALWPYCNMRDRRVYWGERFVCVKPDNKDTKPFKFGMAVDEQYAAYFNHNQLVVKEFEYYYGAEYPNYYCNFESYTNAEFIEIESLSPLITIEAGEESRHIEKWHIYDNVSEPKREDEDAIEKAILANFNKN